MTILTNGNQTFSLVDGKDRNGAAYSPCAVGVSCEHSSAPEGSTVWHDAEHTEELWEVAENPALNASTSLLDWDKLGRELRASADDAHEGETPSVEFAYSFLIDNPECFGYEEWPEGMPEAAPEELQRAYGFVATEVR